LIEIYSINLYITKQTTTTTTTTTTTNTMTSITSLADAQRVFGALTYNDLEADWTDGDGFVRWAGVSYEIEEDSSSDDDDEWVMTAREVGAIVGVDKSVSCVSCSKVELLYSMVIQDTDSFEDWNSPKDARILQLHKGIPPKVVYCSECYLNDYKPKKKEVENKTQFDA